MLGEADIQRLALALIKPVVEAVGLDHQPGHG